jgi:hypothetical protein
MSSFPAIEILQPQDPKAAFILSHSAEQAGAAQEANVPTILVVDDGRLVAETLSEILADSGYSVTTAYDGWVPWNWRLSTNRIFYSQTC